MRDVRPSKGKSIANSLSEMCVLLSDLTAEVLEVAGHHAIRAERGRITPRDIQLSMMADAELWPLVKNAIIPRAGRLP